MDLVYEILNGRCVPIAQPDPSPRENLKRLDHGASG